MQNAHSSSNEQPLLRSVFSPSRVAIHAEAVEAVVVVEAVVAEVGGPVPQSPSHLLLRSLKWTTQAQEKSLFSECNLWLLT